MNIIETTRSKHEDLERFQRIIREQLDFGPKTFKDSVQQSHVVDEYLNKILSTKDELIKLYEDEDNQRKDELTAMLGSGPQIYSVFYDKIKDIRNYYRQFPTLQAERPEDRVYFDVNVPPFTGEESFGRYLDLHEVFIQYQNLKSSRVHRMDYYTFLDHFYKFGNVDQHAARSFASDYKSYLDSLLNYLISFMQRSQPLIDLTPSLNQAEESFRAQWAELSVKKSSIDTIDDNPLHCKACDKTFAKDSVFNAHLTGKKHIKAVQVEESLRIDCLIRETKIAKICNDHLQETIENSRVHVEKKIARGYADNEEEDEVEVVMEENPIEEEVEIQTTKANYPVGWDGKPIPYWLYKLHGLGVEYTCEICGNASYWGRKAYECHFQEWRHAHGMKCLGIPNNLIFRDITKIKDALMLWEKIKRDGNNKEWKPDTEEEFEDKEGNVFNKKVFLDLKRQGLL